jgi:hypothetical protein
MSARIGQMRGVAVVVAIVGVLAIVGGTAFAGGHSAPAKKSHGVSKAQVKKIVKAYVHSHKAALAGFEPKPIEIVLSSSSSTGMQTIAQIGPWSMQAQCLSTGVGVQFVGSGITFGTNSDGVTNGGDGPTFQTARPGNSFGVGTGDQGSQTIDLVGNNGSDYTVTFFENADSSSPVNCDVAGYSLEVKAAS